MASLQIRGSLTLRKSSLEVRYLFLLMRNAVAAITAMAPKEAPRYMGELSELDSSTFAMS